jgi:intraflagellar transport protein 81
MPGFEELLNATSALRKEQEEEGKLADRMAEQQNSLEAVNARYSEVARNLGDVRSRLKDDVTAEALLEGLKREIADSRELAARSLPATVATRRETEARLSALLAEPAKSEEEVMYLRQQVGGEQAAVDKMSADVAAAQRAAGDEKLALFRQQAALVARKLAGKEEALEAATAELEAVSREIEDRVRACVCLCVFVLVCVCVCACVQASPRCSFFALVRVRARISASEVRARHRRRRRRPRCRRCRAPSS